MSELHIIGQKPLSGRVTISGSKNACLPIMAASILAEGPSIIRDAPQIADVETLMAILRMLGVDCDWIEPHQMRLETVDKDQCVCPYELGSEMRASICVLGPLLARRGCAVVPKPGGCIIGDRPVDLHIKGLCALGAKIYTENGYIFASADRLVGTRIYLGGPHGSTVLGTENVMMAATLAEGTTVIEHAACEPEIQDLADFLNACGARIRGAGTHTITIEGVEHLTGAVHTVIPDRIEAGTLAAAAAMTCGDVTIENVRPVHLGAVLDVLEQMGVSLSIEGAQMRVRREGPLRPVDFSALPYPGIPTDMQPQLLALLGLADGTSVVTDAVHPERYAHVAELNKMGAHIVRQGAQAIVRGPAHLSGASIAAQDLRGGAALILAALAAEGVTRLSGIEHVDRGYERIEWRLSALGADIIRVGAPAESAASREQLRRAAS